jgi:hypothetical protein
MLLETEHFIGGAAGEQGGLALFDYCQNVDTPFIVYPEAIAEGGKVITPYRTGEPYFPTRLVIFLVSGPRVLEGTEGQSGGGRLTIPEKKEEPEQNRSTLGPAGSDGTSNLIEMRQLREYLEAQGMTVTGSPQAPAPQGSPQQNETGKKEGGGFNLPANIYDLNVTLNGKTFIEKGIIVRLEGRRFFSPRILPLIDRQAFAGQKIDFHIHFFSRTINRSFAEDFALDLRKEAENVFFFQYDPEGGIERLSPDEIYD